MSRSGSAHGGGRREGGGGHDADGGSSTHSPETNPDDALESLSKAQEDAKPGRSVRNNLLAGGVAGAVSRTAVAPLIRTKILFQVQGLSAQGNPPKYTSVSQSLRDIYRREGVRGLFRGNFANCVRMVPTTAIQFACYERYKEWFFPTDISPTQRLVAGGMAGATAQILTYPLDFMRARLTADMKGKYRGLFSGMAQVVREEGFLRMFQGLTPSLCGIVPYVAMDFAIYEELRQFLPVDDSGNPLVYHKLWAGALAGVCGQTVAFPLDTVRRTLQVQHMKVESSQAYTGMVDCFRGIVARDGWKGLYRGLWPNFLKVGPSVSITFVTFEAVKEWLES